MDIKRPDNKAQKRRRQIVTVGVILLVLVGVTLGLAKLKPAAPSVDGGAIWPDTVKRGPLLRQVRGLGTLVPVDIRWIPAETEARVERIRVLPGTQVEADTVIMELSNPQAEQEAVDAEWQVRAAEAEYKNARVKVEGDLMAQQALAATVSSDYANARRQAETDAELAKLGVISGLALKSSEGRAQEMSTRHEIEKKRIDINTKAIESQMAVSEAKVQEMRALAALRQKNLASLKVRAGIAGVLQEVPVQQGQRVSPGATLAKVAQPTHLKAELKIAETQAKDILIGQPASIDTHNGVISGTVMRVDPAVLNGTVTVDVKLEGELPKGARPDLSVDGTIDLERLANVLYIGRPAFGQEKSTVGMFKIDPDGKAASRVSVKLGRSSVNAIEVLEGLKEGDRVILSDMSRWDNVDRIRLE
ncbi:MAG: Secretion protein HlyD [Acidobacteriales bacterium]|nr:Secretion protein HlyD [Terriglobales bacterium]